MGCFSAVSPGRHVEIKGQINAADSSEVQRKEEPAAGHQKAVTPNIYFQHVLKASYRSPKSNF